MLTRPSCPPAATSPRSFSSYGSACPAQHQPHVRGQVVERADQQLLVLVRALRADAEHDPRRYQAEPVAQHGFRRRCDVGCAAGAVVGDHEALRRDAEPLRDLVARRRGAGDERVRSAPGSLDDQPHGRGRHGAERADPEEGHVVERHDGGHARPDRRDAGQAVQEVGPAAARGVRQRHLLGDQPPLALALVERQGHEADEVAPPVVVQHPGAGPRREQREPRRRELRRERRHQPAQVRLGAAGLSRREEQRVQRHVGDRPRHRPKGRSLEYPQPAHGLLRLARAAGLLPRRHPALPAVGQAARRGLRERVAGRALRRLHGHRRVARRSGARRRARPPRDHRRRAGAAAVRRRDVRRGRDEGPARARERPRGRRHRGPPGAEARRPRVRLVARCPALGVGRLHARAPVHAQGRTGCCSPTTASTSTESATSR